MYALIIAGGEGQRLRPLTNDRPKNMVSVSGRPIVEHQLAWLRENGVTDVVFLCGYKADVLRKHVGDGSRFGVRVKYSYEDEPLGRGGALKKGWSQVGGDEEFVIACNGDVLTDQVIARLVDFHRGNGATATVMLTGLRSAYGIVDLDSADRIRLFREKPVLPYWINAGVYVLGRDFFDLLPDKGDHEDSTFPALAAEGRLYGFRSGAYWRPVDSIKDITDAEAELARMGR